jgi:hypothetical protein
MHPSTISGINRLSEGEKREIYTRFIPKSLLTRFGLKPDFYDEDGNDLIKLKAPKTNPIVEISVFHQHGFPDPVLYGQLQDTLNGQFHILLYVLNDPDSERFNVDRMPDGSSTNFGVYQRNLDAETRAMQAGLSPGQVRRGLRLLPKAIEAFEQFVTSRGHSMYFAEPLYYHNAIIFERYGFAYQVGRRKMLTINEGFAPGGHLIERLDGSTPFRQPAAAGSIRLRSWAIHDGILGEPFNNVTMYKHAGQMAGVSTCPGCQW